MKLLAWIALIAVVLTAVASPGFVILRGEPLRVKVITYTAVIGGSLLFTAVVVTLTFVATGAWP